MGGAARTRLVVGRARDGGRGCGCACDERLALLARALTEPEEALWLLFELVAALVLIDKDKERAVSKVAREEGGGAGSGAGINFS